VYQVQDNHDISESRPSPTAHDLDGREPGRTEQELFELLVDAVKDEPEFRDAIIREYVWRVTAH
jgi:hypothetical protein